jgi:tetratricopeptide (TPR) repeat protein
MAIEGPLRELALTDVFQLLDLSRKTGTLTITPEARSHRPAVIRFERGAVVGAELNRAHERLGHLLLQSGKVTKAQLDAAQVVQKRRPGTPLGTVLVEQGVVSEPDVVRHLRFQIQEIVFELIQWKDGYFRFEESAAAPNGNVPVRVSTESLLMEAARRIDEWSTLEAKVPHMAVVPVLVGDSPDGPALDLHPSEWEVLAEIDGTRTLKEIAGAVGRSDFDVAKIVYGLVSTGVVDIREEAEPVEETPATAERERPLRDALGEARLAIADGAADRARRILDDLARGHPDRPEVYLLLAEAQRRVGRWGEAVISLGRAAALDPLTAQVHYHLGFAAARTGDFHRAREAWETYLRLEDGDEQRRANAREALDAADTLLNALDREAA